MKFVKTPIGLIMHVDNHQALVANAEKLNLRGVLAMLVPAEPLDPATFFGKVEPPPPADD